VQGRELPTALRAYEWMGAIVTCVLDCDARIFSYSVDDGAPSVVFEGLPAGRALYPAVCVRDGWCRALIADNYLVPHVGFVVRTRVMCQSGRARASCARDDVVAWLCERAPLWVVVLACMLLRDNDGGSWYAEDDTSSNYSESD
jgi:hypothetical protein